jgi:hypothetical protein
VLIAANAADERVTTSHRAKLAYVYVRQSSLNQVKQHQESTELQYRLVDRAIALGWPHGRVQVIDEDLGKSGAGSIERHGFQKLIAEIGLGNAGLVVSLDASRLARNNRDWHQLLELCSVFGVLIADGERLYEPRAQIKSTGELNKEIGFYALSYQKRLAWPSPAFLEGINNVFVRSNGAWWCALCFTLCRRSRAPRSRWWATSTTTVRIPFCVLRLRIWDGALALGALGRAAAAQVRGRLRRSPLCRECGPLFIPWRGGGAAPKVSRRRNRRKQGDC